MSNGLMSLALLPGILIIIYIYKKDKVEHEPWKMIFKLMIFGALSCIPAAICENLIDSVVPDFPQGSFAYAFSMAFVSAALCEEVFKFVFLKLGAWRNPEFGYRFDGIVYGVSVAVGFALLENIMYVASGGLGTALMRGVLAVPLHAFCGVFMGIFFGAAKAAQIKGESTFKFNLLAIFVPIVIHGIYDTLAFMGNSTASLLLLAFVVVMYIVSIRFIKQYSKDDWKSSFYPETQPLSGFGPDEQSGQGQWRYSDHGPQSGPQGAGYQSGPQGAGFQNGPQGAGYQSGPQGRGPQGGPAGAGYQRSSPGSSGYRTTGSGYRAYPGQVQDGKIILMCPHCRRGLRVPVGMGQVRIRCPHCGQEFTKAV